MKILIVEDDSDSRLVLRKNLEKAGHEVTEAVQGQDALEKAGLSIPDLIISDILMPVMDGYKLCHEVKMDKHLCRIPFVFYTATYTDPEDARLAMGLGASRFVLKPADPEEFLAIIDEVVLQVKNGQVPVPEEPVEHPLILSQEFESSLSRKLEDKVRELGLYQRIFANAIEAIAVVDKEGCIVRQNPAHGLMLGYSDTEIAGKRAGFYLAEQEHLEILEKIAQGGTATGECPGKMKSSREIFLEYSVFPVLDEQNRIMAHIWMFRNITQRRQAEKQLQEERDRLEKITQCIGAGLAEISPDYRTLWANKVIKNIFGEVEGKRCYETYNQQTDICANCGAREIFENNKPWAVHEQTGKTALGKTIWSQIISTPVRDESGNVTSVIEVVVDITEKKEAEEMLRHAVKMEAVGRLSGGVAHDFNNLLTSILGYSEILMMALPENSRLQEDVKQIHRAGERAALLTRQLLAFSRKQVLEMQGVDLNQLIDNLGKMLGRLIPENIDLQMALSRERSEIYADHGQMEQVIVNLAVNARDAMPQGGSLIIKTQVKDGPLAGVGEDLEPGPHVFLTLTDTGQGILPEHQDKIFEPFFTTKEIGRGTGLGLATVYGIVKQHQGVIFVESEPGKGTTFTLCFPLNRKSARKMPDSRGDDPIMPRGTETILVVDDDEMICEMLESALSYLGYTVLKASGGEQAITLVEAHKGVVHMLLADVVMPVMGGVQLAGIVRKKRPHIKVVLMSGYAQEIIQQKELMEPGYEFLEKPIVPSFIAKKLRRILDGQ